MNPCKLREPKVIDNALIKKCLIEQGPKGEAGRLTQVEGIPLEEIKQLRLEFLNLLRIDHLWVLTSLTKLSMNNNLLEKIEHLETLVHLTELDLSFNKISKIENLDALVKLEKLSFFENMISVIENMDTLENLTILSIGRNKIDDLDNLLYLRRLKNLKSLNLVENPVSEDENFRLFIAVFLQHIVYYEYKLLQESERQRGAEVFSAKLRLLAEAEETERFSKEKEERARADAALHSSSFVEYLNSNYLFEQMFKDDVDGRALLSMGDDAMEYYVEYDEQFTELCLQIFAVGQQQYTLRKNEHNSFVACVTTAKNKNQEDGIVQMEKFMTRKNEIFSEIRELQELLNSQKIKYQTFMDKCEVQNEQFEDLVHETWKALMKLEMELYEQMEEVNQNFEHSMTELVNVFIEASQALFSLIRALEVTYSENMTECALHFLTNAQTNEEIEIPPSIKDLMSDKEILHNALAGSHDMHLQIIDNREDTLVHRTHAWLNGLVDNLGRDEVKRNRDKILEINHFLDTQREECDDLNGEYAPDMDAEVAAVIEA